jgi:hypothetical protein
VAIATFAITTITAAGAVTQGVQLRNYGELDIDAPER